MKHAGEKLRRDRLLGGFMHNNRTQAIMGVATIAASAFLIFVAIPFWVSSPSNVSNIILSPLFWPYTLACITALIGVGMVVMSKSNKPALEEEEQQPSELVEGGYLRLTLMAIVMIAYVVILPWLGMVWTSMLAFMAVAFLVRTSHPRTAVICAIIIPLVLYAFFAHVAGVAIPQGELVRLP